VRVKSTLMLPTAFARVNLSGGSRGRGRLARMDHLKVQEIPQGLRRPILIMAFTGWNDAAESATTAARYVATSFDAEKFAEIDPEEFYHFGLTRPLVRYRTDVPNEREIVWPATEFLVTRSSALPRDLVVGVAAEPHLRWKTYCATVLELARRCEISLVLTLGALLAEVPHTRPVRLSGTATDPELRAVIGARTSRYEGPTGIVGVLNIACREQGMPTASLWANVPHYISGIENPKATLALVKRVLSLLPASIDLSDLDEAVKQFDQNLAEIVSQNAKIAGYVTKLEKAAKDEDEEPATAAGQSDLPPASELVAEIEQFLRQQRPE
jgi:proteasome assembly chaperone (PAC2) family protein